MIVNAKLAPKQHLALQMLDNDFTAFLLFGGAAGGAKSWLGCVWLLSSCYRYPGSKWFIGRKELKRLMSSTYITWLKVCTYYKIPETDWKLNGQYNYIEFVAGKAQGSRIDLLDLAPQPSDPLYERFGSLEYTGGWIEEAGEVEFSCFDVLKTRVGRHLNDKFSIKRPKLLLTCNPTQNWLYRVFYKPFRDSNLPLDYAFIRSLHGDNPFNPESYHEQLDKITDPVQKARLRDGLWEYSVDDLNLINYDAILEVFSNPISLNPLGYFSGDIARFGSDRIVLGAWRGLDLYNILEKTKQSQTQTEEDIRNMLMMERIPYSRAVVDEDGVGGGVVDHLAGIHGFVGNRAAVVKPIEGNDTGYLNVTVNYLKRENFKNLRSQCYFKLAEKINNHEILISAPITETQRESIIEELQQIKRVDTNPDAPLQVVGKDEIKEALGRSPDYADMLMMRLYFEIVKKDEVKNVYNPPNVEVIRQSGAISDFGGVPFEI